MSLPRHRKHPELKIIRAQESIQGKYQNCLPLPAVLQESNYGQWVCAEGGALSAAFPGSSLQRAKEPSVLSWGRAELRRERKMQGRLR